MLRMSFRSIHSRVSLDRINTVKHSKHRVPGPRLVISYINRTTNIPIEELMPCDVCVVPGVRKLWVLVPLSHTNLDTYLDTNNQP